MNEAFSLFNTWMTVEATNICSYSCIMCHVKDFDALEPTMMRYRTFSSILHSIHETGCRLYGMKLFWLGEPTLNPDFSAFLSHPLLPEVTRALVFDTNLSGLNSEIRRNALELASKGCDTFVFLSLDAACRETYEKIRRGGDFEAVFRRLGEFVRERKGERLFFRFQFIPMEENERDTVQFVEKISEITGYPVPVTDREDTVIPLDYIYLRRLVLPDGIEKGEKYLLKARRALEAAGYRVYSQLSQEKKEPLKSSGPVSHQEKEMELNTGRELNPDLKGAEPDSRVIASRSTENTETKKMKIWCEFPFTMPMIRADGRVTVCSMDLELSLAVGDITYEGIAGIWEGERVRMLRKAHLSGDLAAFPKCAGCSSRAVNHPVSRFEEYLKRIGGEDSGTF